MALIIKGAMPKGCGWDCHYVAVNKYYDERDDKIHKCVFCALNHSIRYKDSGFPEEYEHTRHPDCPIIGEIPDKHGRLVEADEITDAIIESERNGEINGGEAGLFTAIVHNAKTIIPSTIH